MEKYCLDFCDNWLYNSPDAEKYRVQMGDEVGVCYDETDFIDYLNKYICNNQATLIEMLTNVYSSKKLPEQYRNLPYFNF